MLLLFSVSGTILLLFPFLLHFLPPFLPTLHHLGKKKRKEKGGEGRKGAPRKMMIATQGGQKRSGLATTNPGLSYKNKHTFSNDFFS